MKFLLAAGRRGLCGFGASTTLADARRKSGRFAVWRGRAIMNIIKAVGGRDGLWLATANRLETLPPELQRRFNLGIWYFDVPSKEERAAIWAIQRKRFGIESNDLPD